MALNAKRQRFVAEYLKDLNATQAAIRAGYSAKSAYQQGFSLLRNPEVASAVSEKTQKAIGTADLSAARVLEELRRLAFSDVRGLFDGNGNLRPIKELTDEQAAAIASVEVVHRNVTAGDNVTDTIHKLKTWDKTRSLEMLAKHFALLTERVDLSGEVGYRWLGDGDGPST